MLILVSASCSRRVFARPLQPPSLTLRHMVTPAGRVEPQPRTTYGTARSVNELNASTEAQAAAESDPKVGLPSTPTSALTFMGSRTPAAFAFARAKSARCVY